MEIVDCVVIGAGVVGLAVARELSLAGREVLIVESEDRFGNGVSSRNSEVIHAGIYYSPGSMKARSCVEGNKLLYRYCAERGIPHKNTGKVIVATSDDQKKSLEKYKKNADLNGADELKYLTTEDLKSLEPSVHGVAGLYSPATGIVDSHQLMLGLLGDAEQKGAYLLTGHKVVSGKARLDGIDLDIKTSSEIVKLRAKTVINSSSLHASTIARSIEGMPITHIPETYFAKGHYFTFKKPSPFNHLVYPMPEDGGLGVHVTLDLAGQVRFGPDVQWLDKIDYSFDETRADSFSQSIRNYYPDISVEDLQPSYVGIRPKLSGKGMAVRDFEISGTSIHGVPGLLHLFGIESPGLTSCLYLAQKVAETIKYI